ncbi:MAG: hypothetical protein IKE38_04005 [Erysipelotrichaceae bacterium]|nr:hypothetical protein [Erysipelotrichaceae bacterium]
MDNVLLLKTLLLSTSQINILKYCKDKKKRGRIIGSAIAYVIVYAAIMFYCVLMCIGYGAYGMIDAVPVMCALIISILAFFFTLFKTNGYLFNFKEYDMLMSLPFPSKTVAASKFLYMYIKSLPWYLSVSLAMMIGYGFYARPAFYVYIIWIFLTLILPVIPMLASAFLGYLIARISSGFRKTNIIQTVLSFLVVVFSFSLRFSVEGMFKDGKVESALEQAFDMTRKTGRIYLPAGWFEDAVLKQDLLSIALLVITSIGLFAVLFRIVGNSYRRINSALKSHAASRNYKVAKLKTKSVLNAIAFKEFKRLSGSTVYMTNAAVGEFLAILFGIITLVFGFDKIIGVIVQNAPFDYALL